MRPALALSLFVTLLLVACGEDGRDVSPASSTPHAPPTLSTGATGSTVERTPETATGGADVTSRTITEPTPAADDDRLHAAFSELDRRQMPVLAAIAQPGRPTIVREFGPLENDGVPAEDTQVDLNSITKTVTGVTVMKLVEQGEVQLDQPLVEIFPAIPADKRAITVHQLLTHSAGFVESVGDDAEVLTRQAFLERAFATELVARPGEEYHYSNVGYSVLAAIIEQRSEVRYEDFLREDVLAPAGLDGIGYESVYEEARSLRDADGRAIREASWGGHAPSWNLIGNGGLVSTAEAFVRFRQAVVAGEVISPASVEKLHTAHVPEDQAGTSFYGYGLVVQELPDIGQIYWHDGGNDIFSAMWADFTEQGDLVFTAGADSRAGDAFAAMSRIQAQLYGTKHD